MTTDQARRTFKRLESELAARDTKYRRNYRMYFDSYRGEDMRNPTSQPLGLYFSVDPDTDRSPPIINVAKRAVDTIISSMSQVKVRPFFNPINGKFQTRKVARKAQWYFDQMFQKENVYVEAPEILRDAAIFEVGYYWPDEENECLRRVRPWEFYYSQNEWHYDQVSVYHLRFDYYPLRNLKQYLKDAEFGGHRQLIADMERDPLKTITYRIVYDLEGGERIDFCNDYEIRRTKIPFKCCTVQAIYYKKPVKGGFSTSLIDDVYTIQLQINDICRKISTAVNLSPANFILVPKGQGSIKASMISADNGYVYEFTPIPGAPPITVVTPAPFDPAYLETLKFFIEQGMNTPGVSEMQALAKKPGSLQSGNALETLDDIYSNRQNVILNAYISLLVRTAESCIAAFKGSKEVIPGDTVTWSQVREQADKYRIQFSAASSLSKDPKTKQEQVMNLVAGGFMNQAMASQYLELPDIEDVYNVITSAQNYNRWVVERVAETGKMDFYQVTDMSELFQFTVSELLQCAAADEDPEILKRLSQFLDVLMANTQAMQPPPPQPIPAQPGMAIPQQGAQNGQGS